MPIYITQGRYARDALKGMVARPEDRSEQVARLVTKAGGRLIGFYLTFGAYDFLAIIEMPGEMQMASALMAAASGGGVTDLCTVTALSPSQMKGALAAASELARGFRSAGGV
jgi:uncharacterized protein with GYD domain